MATKKANNGATKVRLLIDSSLGRVDDVIEMSGDELDAATAAGMVDANPAAVEYAESLKAGE